MSSFILIDYAPVINTCLLVGVLLVIALLVTHRRAEDAAVAAIYRQNSDLLALLKVLIAELRVRPCILPEHVRYLVSERSDIDLKKEKQL